MIKKFESIAKVWEQYGDSITNIKLKQTILI